MKNFLIAFIVFLVWSFFGLWIYSWLQPETKTTSFQQNIIKETRIIVKNDVKKNIVKPIIDSSVVKDSIIEKTNRKDSILVENKEIKKGLIATNLNGDVIFLFNDGIQITKNSIELSISKSLVDYKYKIYTYLLEHPNQELHICSLYSPLEEVSNPNIGILRTSELKEDLLKVGVLEEKIVMKSIIKDLKFSEEGVYKNAIYFFFKKLDLTRVETFRKSIPNKRIVYPKFTESGISVNNDLKILLSEIILYFSKYPDKNIEIVGHTDNIGNSNDNYSVGLKYAQQVRWYLISKGNIKKALVKASSKGESEPIDSNFSKQGRNKNRRIEVLFK